MKVSWVILTYNRADTVAKAIQHCARNAGHKFDEIVWVDNGSSPEEYAKIGMFFSLLSAKYDTKITACALPQNTGVAKGYNTAMALARGTHMVITGCDMLMPDNWLRDMVYVEKQNGVGISLIYADNIEKTPERIRSSATVNFGDGLMVREAMPIGRRFLSIELQREIGYFHEGFGMYGWDDVYWGNRAEVVLKEKGLKSYCLVDRIAEHLGTEGNVGYDHKDEHEYWNWKKREVDDPKKQELLNDLRRMGWPRFTPY